MDRTDELLLQQPERRVLERRRYTVGFARGAATLESVT